MANLEEDVDMRISGSSHQTRWDAQVLEKKRADEIVKLLPKLYPGLTQKLLDFLQGSGLDKRTVVLEVTSAGVKALLKKVCEIFAAELKALLGSLGGAVEQEGGSDLILQLSLCLLLGLAPSLELPDAREICVRNLNPGPGTMYGGEQAVGVLCSALMSQQWSSGVRRLRIWSSEAFGTERACVHLAHLLKSDHCKLQELQMEETGMGAGGMRYIARALQTNSSLTLLNIVGCEEVGDGGVEELAVMLQTNSTLQKLTLENIGMTAHGSGLLTKGLLKNSNLQELDISDNKKVGKVALEHFVRCLATNYHTRLKTLKMDRMGEMPAAEELAHMIISNRSLQHLSLQHATYSAKQWATVILPALGRNKTLLSIDLEGCPGVGGEEVWPALFDLLYINTTIQEIRLDSTPLKQSGKAEAVEVELRRNNEFRHALSALPKAKPRSCRIVLCGHAYAGKSSLFETLKLLALKDKELSKRTRHNYDNLKDKELSKRTRGIDIHLLKDEEDCRISVWDLAGHREFHALHDFMFPSGSNSATLFVLTLSPFVSPADALRAGQVKTDRELEEELVYWLRFMASNSKPSATPPTVVVVITHMDTLLELGTHVESWLQCASHNIIAPLATKFRGRVTVHRQPFMVNALASEDPELNRWVEEVEKSLRSTLVGLKDEPAICTQVLKALQHVSQTSPNSPIISKDEFGNICRSCLEVEMARLRAEQRLEDEKYRSGGFGDPEIVKAVGDRVGTVVGAYLHDAGEVIHHAMLNLVVSNLKWFCHGVLGHLIDLLPSSSSQRPKRPKNGLVTRDYLSSLLQGAVERVPGLDPKLVTPDQLIQLMLWMDLCYEQKPGDPNTDYFLPTIFDDEGNKAANGERPLTWRESNPDSTFVGRRLQCADEELTFLTDGFFPRLQVVLHNHAFKMEWVKNWYSDTYKLEKNLFSIWVNGMEILIEFSGCSGYFVDILVQSSKSHEETMEFVRFNIIGTIRTFCATQEGCQGVTLAEAVIRPECLFGASGGNPILCTHRRNQAVLVEDLTKQVRSSPNWEHSWDKVGDGGCVLRFGKDLGTVLLGNWQQLRYVDKNTGRGKRRGLALIVSMESGRRGADVDRGKLAKLFLTCGFKDVQQHVDLKSSELINTIKSAESKYILEEDEAFICSINGHGGTQHDGQLYIMDAEKVKVMVMRDIVEPFQRSEHLFNKPKVFFINCCRGTKLYENSCTEEADDDDQHGGAQMHDGQQGAESVLRPLKELSDCLLVFSTSEGCRSCRNVETGTIFVEKLVETVIKERQTTDVQDMMTMVNDRVTKVQNSYVVDDTEVKIGQCCEVRSSLRKKLYWQGA